MSRGHFIGLNHHRVMLTDPVRMESYRRAVEATVKPGDVVYDLGTGTGILAMWAAKAGARRVFATDPAPIIRLAACFAKDNPGGDRIEFLEADSRDVDLPEPADVLITECMGNFFVTDELAPVLRDARRHLKPGARIIPDSISLLVCPVFYPNLDDVTFWSSAVYGLDLSGARPYALQTTYVRHVDPRLLIAEPAELLSFQLLEAPDDIVGEVTFRVPASRTVHAFVGWFDARLTPELTLSTAPGVDTHWAQLVFPIEPMRVDEGDSIEFQMRLTMADTDRDFYTKRWRWFGQAMDASGAQVAEFDHDTAHRFEK